MGNKLPTAVDHSPLVLTPDVPTANELTGALGGWLSKPFWVEGVEYGAEEVDFYLEFALNGATQITIRPEWATRDAPAVWFPSGRVNSSFEVENDTILILPANLDAGQTTIQLGWKAKAGAAIRLNAFATGGANPTLTVKIAAGGGGARA